MTTPKDTWIRVKDAMPPKEIPVGFDLIGMTHYGEVERLKWDESTLRYDNNEMFAAKITDWMLLSKPKTK